MRKLIVLLVGFSILACAGERKRTQEPIEPFPYQSVDVSYHNPVDDVLLSATLTTPDNDTLNTGVVLIGGSGRSDRDYENQFGHRPFLVLSHHLTQQGISVLRYDERGVGRSEGNYDDATYETMVSDIVAGIKFLREKGFRKVGLIGHSEGGGMAPVSSLRVHTDFLVLMAPDHCTADKSLIYQTGTRLTAMGIGGEARQEIVATVDSLMKILKAEPDIAKAKAKMENLIAEKEKTACDDCREAAERMGDPRQLIRGFTDPKFVYRLHNDPLQALDKMRVPVLVLLGGADGSQDFNTNLPAIEKALDSTEHEIKIFPELGHLFIDSRGVPIDKLHEIEETIAPEVLTYISNWIEKLKLCNSGI